ncbi:MAG: tetratricopeptide repeat protein [Treponema sp.]|nr:tetratricopeptide repeat protein [Treponema sp.]
MFNNKTRSRYGRHIFMLNKFHALLIVLFVFLAVFVSFFIVSRVKNSISNDKRELLKVWNDGDFEQAYTISKNALLQKPVDYFLLTMNGFSAFQLGVSQINNQATLFYIDESIFALRKALLFQQALKEGRLFYVLGKAYGYKGAEYSDLAVKYLEIASDMSFNAADIPEYLGIAYAASGDYRNSVAAFSQSFIPNEQPSDKLLLSIARSYISMEDFEMAEVYLKQCVVVSPDSNSISVARFLLAEVYIKTHDYENAEMQYLSILNESGENAEVHFQLGELYNLKGDTTRARSEWRIATRQNPAHAKARARLNI